MADGVSALLARIAPKQAPPEPKILPNLSCRDSPEKNGECPGVLCLDLLPLMGNPFPYSHKRIDSIYQRKKFSRRRLASGSSLSSVGTLDRSCRSAENSAAP